MRTSTHTRGCRVFTLVEGRHPTKRSRGGSSKQAHLGRSRGRPNRGGCVTVCRGLSQCIGRLGDLSRDGRDSGGRTEVKPPAQPFRNSGELPIGKPVGCSFQQCCPLHLRNRTELPPEVMTQHPIWVGSVPCKHPPRYDAVGPDLLPIRPRSPRSDLGMTRRQASMLTVAGRRGIGVVRRSDRRRRRLDHRTCSRFDDLAN